MGGRTLPSVPILPTAATIATHPHNPLVLTREEIKVDEPVPIVTEDQGLTTKQKIRDWIQNQVIQTTCMWDYTLFMYTSTYTYTCTCTCTCT